MIHYDPAQRLINQRGPIQGLPDRAFGAHDLGIVVSLPPEPGLHDQPMAMVMSWGAVMSCARMGALADPRFAEDLAQIVVDAVQAGLPPLVASLAVCARRDPILRKELVDLAMTLISSDTPS